MLNTKLFNKKLFLIAVLSIVLLLQPSYAFARHRSSRIIHRPSHHRRVFSAPHDYISISIGGLKFCYGDDAFYRKRTRRHAMVRPHGYVVVPAPVVYIVK